MKLSYILLSINNAGQNHDTGIIHKFFGNATKFKFKIEITLVRKLGAYQNQVMLLIIESITFLLPSLPSVQICKGLKSPHKTIILPDRFNNRQNITLN